MQLPFRDYSLTAILAFAALTIAIVKGTMATLQQWWFIALIALVAVSAGLDLWRMKRDRDPNSYRRW
jgi:hypothetical protein